MAASWRTDVATWTTANGSKTATITTVAGDFLVVYVAHTGNLLAHAVTDNQGGTYYQYRAGIAGTTADSYSLWVRTTLVATGVSTIVTTAPGTTTGGGLIVVAISGMLRSGSEGIRQIAYQENHGTGSGPDPVFPVAPLTENMVLGFLENGTSPATLTPRTNFTERQDIGFANPSSGIYFMSRDSGETATTQTWGGASPSFYTSLVVELQVSDKNSYYYPVPSRTHYPSNIFGPRVLDFQRQDTYELSVPPITIDAAASVTVTPTAAIDATKVIAAAASTTVTSTAAIGGTFGITGSQTVTVTSTAAINATKTLDDAASVTVNRTADINATKVIADAQTVTVTTTAAIGGTFGIAGSQTETVNRTADINATKTLDAAASTTVTTTGAIGGTFGITGSLTETVNRTAAIDATKTLDAAATVSVVTTAAIEVATTAINIDAAASVAVTTTAAINVVKSIAASLTVTANRTAVISRATYLPAISSSVPVTVQTLQNVVLRYVATWSATWKHDGTYNSVLGGSIVQGIHVNNPDYPEKNRGLIGFDVTQIQQDLSDYVGTVKVEVGLKDYAYNENLSTFSTIHVMLGYHDFINQPLVWQDARVAEKLQDEPMFVAQGFYMNTADITNMAFPVDLVAGFADGTINGIAVGPPPSDSQFYYIRILGYTTAVVGDRPYIEFTVTKWK